MENIFSSVYFTKLFIADFLKREVQIPKPNETHHYDVP